MNAIMEQWIGTCRRELLDHTLIWNQAHLLGALRQFEALYNHHRPHRTLSRGAPLRATPELLTDLTQLTNLTVRRRDRLGGILHGYEHAA